MNMMKSMGPNNVAANIFSFSGLNSLMAESTEDFHPEFQKYFHATDSD